MKMLPLSESALRVRTEVTRGFELVPMFVAACRVTEVAAMYPAFPGLKMPPADVRLNDPGANEAIAGGVVQCWGEGTLGRLGNDQFSNVDVPATVPGITNAVSISAGPTTTCAATSRVSPLARPGH